MNPPGTGEPCPRVQQGPRRLSEVLDYPSLTPVGSPHLGWHPGVPSGAVSPGTGQTVRGWDAEHPFCIIPGSCEPQAAVGCSPTTEVSVLLHGEANLGEGRHPARVMLGRGRWASCSPLGPHPALRPRSSSHLPRAGLVPVTLTLSRSTSGPWRSPALATQRHQLEVSQRAECAISDCSN